MVSQIRLNATMTQNVVTYTVVVTTENKDLRLKPYMTANVNFEIEHHDDVLKVPNAALRWKPRPPQIAPDIRAETLAEMNRRGDKSKGKSGDAEKPVEKTGKGEKTGDNKDSGKDAKTGQAAAAPSGAAAQRETRRAAVSGGTDTGTKPEDWKARARGSAA